MGKIKIAMLQMLVKASQLNENLHHAADLIHKAKSMGCDIAVLPECFDLGWSNPSAKELAFPIPGFTSNYLCETAKREQVYLVAGITETEADKVYNTALMISDHGTILAKHRKIHILSDVEGVYSVGSTVSVTDTPFGRIGISICADNSIGSMNIGHTLARMGAEMILSPCSWAVPPLFDNKATPYGPDWLVPYTRLTSLYDIYIIGVSNVGPVSVGPWKEWDCIGNSIAMGPGGKIVSILPHGSQAENVEIIDIEPSPRTIWGTELADHLEAKGYHFD